MSYPVFIIGHLVLALLYLGLWRWPASLSNHSTLRLLRIGVSAVCGLAVTFSCVSEQGISWGPLLGLAAYYLPVAVFFGRYRRYVKDIIVLNGGQACHIPVTVCVNSSQKWFYYANPSFAVILTQGDDFSLPDVLAVHLWIKFAPRAIARIYEASGQVDYALPSGSIVSLFKDTEKIMHERVRAALKQGDRPVGFASGNFPAIHEATAAVTKVLEDFFGFQVEFGIIDVVEMRYSSDNEPEPDDSLYESAEAQK